MALLVLAGHAQVTDRARSSSLGLVTFLDPGQDPVVHLAIDPADAAVAQRYRFREGAFRDVFVDGRPGKTCRVDDFFQTDDSHEQAPLWLRGSAGVVKNYSLASNLYAHTITDYGYMQDKTTAQENKLLGLGLGFGLFTKNGF